MPRYSFLLSLAASLLAASPILAQSPGWPAEIRQESKPWTRWWWLGSAVDKANLTRELEAIAAAGFGGVEITPIYGAKGAEAQFIDFLSPKYVEMLVHTTAEAKRLGLAVDMATGTGWPFGGKQVGKDDAELRIEIKDGEFVPKLTKFRVKRAAPGAEGWVLNPFSAAAMTRYLAPFSAALSQLPAGALHGQFHDSFEYTANWSKELPERFQAKFGYRLENYIDALSGKGDPDTIARIKSDYRELLSELHLEYMQTWIAWTHSRGQIARNQAHGAPANLLDLYALSDVPETEVFGASAFPIPGYRFDPDELSRNEPQPLVNRLASSAGHVMGKPLISSETFTWLREHFHEAPSEMKPELDQLLLLGVNHVFYHGTAYSPESAPWPGWLFYASTQANPRNPLWNSLSSVNEYIARSQAVLQAGKPDNDFLLYWPVYDLWHQAEGWNRNFSMHGKDWLTDSTTGQTAQELLKRGFSFDFVSDEQLQRTNLLEKQLQTPGARYRALIIPSTRLMPARTLERIVTLARQGAVVLVVGDLPVDVPGFGKLAERRQHFQQLRNNLTWRDENGLKTSAVGRGRIHVAPALADLLSKTAVAPEGFAAAGLSAIRRSLGGAPVYFVANLSGEPFSGWVTLARSAKAVALYDPLTGTSGVAASRAPSGGSEVYLQLTPGQSIVIKGQAKSFGELKPWKYISPQGEAVPLKGTWKVTFVSGGPERPEPYSTDQLGSWTSLNAAAERFAGTAVYEIEFEAPTAAADDWQLNLGDVREVAEVSLNGTSLGTLWSLPFAVRVGALLKPGQNTLRVSVTNLAANRIRFLDQTKFPWKNFHEINFVNAQYQPLDAAAWRILPSGLLGPVRLVPQKNLQP